MKSLKFVLICLTVFGLVLVSSNVFAKQTLIYGTTEKIIDMDPANAYDFHTWEIFYNIYEGLMKYRIGDTRLEPGLAKSYDISGDGKEYTFKLREGLKFTDGTEFDANAVKWSMDRVMAVDYDGPEYTIVSDMRSSATATGKYDSAYVFKGDYDSGYGLFLNYFPKAGAPFALGTMLYIAPPLEVAALQRKRQLTSVRLL